MTIAIIAAVSDNGFIGKDGDLPWRLRDDMRWFMRRTKGSTVVMGRRTYESMNTPLPDRRNIVLTRNPAWSAPGVVVARDLDTALALAEDDPVFIIGGEAVYRAALPVADRLDLTRVHTEVEGDTRFPTVNWSSWERRSAERHEPDAHNDHAFTIEVWTRRETRSLSPEGSRSPRRSA